MNEIVKYMSKLKLNLIVIFIIGLSISPLKGELTEESSTVTEDKKDTVCIKYEFHPGDTLYYRLEAHDSITIEYNPPILKKRYQRLRIVCDSVNEAKHFFLSLQMTDYISKQRVLDSQQVTRKNNPWLSRKVSVEIDSLGKRCSYSLGNDSTASLAPGGAFQPYLIVPFGTSCKEISETWIVEDSMFIPENGIPMPAVRHTYLYRMKEPIDTLDKTCYNFEFINTGQGSIEIISEETNMKVTSVMNGHGTMKIDTANFIPVHMFAALEQKLKISSPGSGTQPGWHYISLDYTLDRYIPAKKREED